MEVIQKKTIFGRDPSDPDVSHVMVSTAAAHKSKENPCLLNMLYISYKCDFFHLTFIQ